MAPITFETLQKFVRDEMLALNRLQANQEHIMNQKLTATDYMVYSYAALPALISKMKSLRYDEDERLENLPYKARFVVDMTGAMWFSLEGRPRRGVPAHSDMSKYACVAAGMVQFSTDYASIVLISNQSGHFTPNIGTLGRSIAALQNLNAILADNVTIQCIENEDSQEEIILTREQVYQLLADNTCINSNTEYSIGVYSNDEWCFFAEGDTPVINHTEPVTQPRYVNVCNTFTESEAELRNAQILRAQPKDPIILLKNTASLSSSSSFNNLLSALTSQPATNKASFFNASSQKRICIRNEVETESHSFV